MRLTRFYPALMAWLVFVWSLPGLSGEVPRPSATQSRPPVEGVAIRTSLAVLIGRQASQAELRAVWSGMQEEERSWNRGHTWQIRLVDLTVRGGLAADQVRSIHQAVDLGAEGIVIEPWDAVQVWQALEACETAGLFITVLGEWAGHLPAARYHRLATRPAEVVASLATLAGRQGGPVAARMKHRNYAVLAPAGRREEWMAPIRGGLRQAPPEAAGEPVVDWWEMPPSATAREIADNLSHIGLRERYDASWIWLILFPNYLPDPDLESLEQSGGGWGLLGAGPQQTALVSRGRFFAAGPDYEWWGRQAVQMFGLRLEEGVLLPAAVHYGPVWEIDQPRVSAWLERWRRWLE